MITLLTVAGWLAVLTATGVAALCAWQAVERTGDKDYARARHSVIAATLLACAVVCGVTILGALPALAGVGFGTVLALTGIGTVWYETDQARDRGAAAVLADARTATRAAVTDAARRPRKVKNGTPPAATVIPGHAEPPSHGGGPARVIPPVREDPALTEPAPGDVAPGSVVPGDIPPDWASLCSRRADFESGDKDEFLAFFRAEAAGFLAYAEAMRSCAEHHGEPGVGLDPACVQAVFQFADAVGDAAHGASLIRRRLLAVYGGIIDAIDAGLRIPKDARRWLGGGAGRGEAA